MNHLRLVQTLRRKCRVAGGDPATLQGTLPEEQIRLKSWINEAWLQIQLMQPDWFWMRADASFQTIAGQSEYTLAQTGVTDLGRWDHGGFRCYSSAAGFADEMPLEPVNYPDWRNVWRMGATRSTQSRPVVFCVLPNYGIGLGPAPLAGYTVTGQYFRAPQELAADTDEPTMPAAYHMAIVYRAMTFYGASEAAAEVYQEGELEFRRMAARMMAREAHGFGIGAALA